jgi:hypothetical protein
MSISGNLRTMELSELLQWLNQGKKSGTLIVDDGRVNKKIYFEKGNIVSSASNRPSEYLGHFLVSHGFITEAELAKAVEIQETTPMLLGKILVTIGGISEEDLRRLLMLKTEESVYDMFSWEEAEFRFVDDERIDRGMIPISLDVTGIILHGMNRLDEWNRIRKYIPSSGCIPVAVGFLDEPDAEPGERQILRLVDDDRTVQEICLESHSSEFFVCQTLFQQIEKGRLKIVRPRDAQAPVGASPTPNSHSTDMPVLNAEVLLQAAERHLEEKTYERALRHLRAARSLEPDNDAVMTQVKAGEERIRSSLREDGIDVSRIPRLSRSVDELTGLRLSPEEGFVLSRIDGNYDIQSILKISPMDQLDAQLVFHKLLKSGHITLEARGS